MSTHNIPFSIQKRKSPLKVLNLNLLDLFQGTQERVRNSRGKRAISARATEVLLYVLAYSCLILPVSPMRQQQILSNLVYVKAKNLPFSDAAATR